MLFSNLKQTTILNILIVVIMMRMTCASFMQFLLKVDKSIMKHLSPWWKEKGCHRDDNETVPRQRSGSGNSIEIPVQRKCDGSVTCDRRWGAPGYRVPTWRWQGKRGKRAPTNRARCKHEHLIHHNAFIHGGRLGVIPSKRALPERSGSSGVVVPDRRGK